jgi:hypothetical protein
MAHIKALREVTVQSSSRADPGYSAAPFNGRPALHLGSAKLFEAPLRVDSEHDRDSVATKARRHCDERQGKRPSQARLEPACAQCCAFGIDDR